MNTNHEHLDAESAELARGLDDLARAERSAAGAGFEGRIAGTTYPHLVSARAKASGLSLAGSPAQPGVFRRVMPAMRIAASLGLAAVVTFVIIGRGSHGPNTPGESPVAFTDAEWSMVFADSGTSDLLTDTEQLEKGIRTWNIDEDAISEGAM